MNIQENNMINNMGSADKIIRVLIAIILGILFFTGTVEGTWGIILLILGIVFILTSFISFCPLYYPFKISTKKSKSE